MTYLLKSPTTCGIVGCGLLAFVADHGRPRCFIHEPADEKVLTL